MCFVPRALAEARRAYFLKSCSCPELNKAKKFHAPFHA